MKYNFDIRYRILQLWVNPIFRLNFRKIVRTGTENIPKGKPVIYAPSHRNALIDALVFVYENVKKQVVFLARADIFKKPTIIKLLTLIRIMPVYRMRDGKENLAKNEAVFEECGKLLENENPLCLFPEAVYNPHQSLLQLKKAIPKIALPTEAKSNFQLDTYIVPVALHYMNKDAFLDDLYITYCTPIRVADYKDLYFENENLAYNKMRNDMDTQLRSKIVDIPVDECYDQRFAFLEYHTKQLGKKTFSTRKDAAVLAKQQLMAELNELEKEKPILFQEQMNNIKTALEKLKAHKIFSVRYMQNVKSTSTITLNYILLIITSPLALASLLNSIISIFTYRKLVSKIKDKQFISSIRVAIGILFAPIAYILQTVIVGIIFHSLLIAFIYFMVSPIAFYLGLYWRKWWKINTLYCRINNIYRKYPQEWIFITQAFARQKN